TPAVSFSAAAVSPDAVSSMSRCVLPGVSVTTRCQTCLEVRCDRGGREVQGSRRPPSSGEGGLPCRGQRVEGVQVRGPQRQLGARGTRLPQLLEQGGGIPPPGCEQAAHAGVLAAEQPQRASHADPG